MPSLKSLGMALVASTAIVFAGPALAEWPDKPITMVVPYNAGGSTDTLIRVFAEGFAEAVGTDVVVQNRPGAGGAVGATWLTTQEPDGYTFVIGSLGIVAWAPLYDQVTYTPEDFELVGAITEYQQAIITTPDKPYTTLDELVAYAKENPGMVFADQGSSTRVLIEHIGKEEGIDWRAIPTGGGGGMLPMLFGGQLDFAYSGGVHQRYGDDEIRVLASVNPGPLAATPEIPVVADKYGLSLPSYVTVMAPAGLDPEITAKMGEALQAAQSYPPFVELMEERLKFPILFLSADELDAFVPQQIEALQGMLESAQ